MKTLPAPREAAVSFVDEMLLTQKVERLFRKLDRSGKIGFLVNHLIGPETERYAAEPVYAVQGKGYLKSKGVDGMRDETELEDFLRGEEGRVYADATLREIRKKIHARTADDEQSFRRLRLALHHQDEQTALSKVRPPARNDIGRL